MCITRNQSEISRAIHLKICQVRYHGFELWSQLPSFFHTSIHVVLLLNNFKLQPANLTSKTNTNHSPLRSQIFPHIFSNLKGSIFLLTTHEYSRFYRIKSWVDLVLRRLMLVTPPTKQSKLQQYAHTHKHILSTVIILRLSQPQDLVLGTLLWERSIKTLPLICSPNNIIFLKLLFLQHQNQSESSSYPYKFSLKQKSVLPQTLCFHQKNFLYFTLGADII